jgi:aryl-alcohol dehydrogenase-like predicted oxidoreductase
MQYTRLGNSGLQVSRIGLGMMTIGDPTDISWMLTEDRAEPLVRRAVEGGVTFFDTADMYSTGVSEQLTGRLLRKLFRQRDEYVLATKVYYPMAPHPNGRGLSRKHILDAVDASLNRLGTDHIDLYQIHRWDDSTPIEETMSALHDVVKAGKVRYLGASLMYAWQFATAQFTAQAGSWTKFVSMQTRYNLVYREEEREMIPFCVAQGVGVLPYSPLARGMLAVHPGENAIPRTPRSIEEQALRTWGDNDREVADALAKVAASYRVPPAQVALSWLLSQPGVSAPIVGATRVSHIEDALAAVDLDLSKEDMSSLSHPYRSRPLISYS